MKKIVIVIGSNSFSGSNFIDLLLKKGEYLVIGLSRSPEKSALFLPYLKRNSPNFMFSQMDLNKDMDRIIQILNYYKPSYIVNFASQSEVATSWVYPTQWYQTNIIAVTDFVDRIKNKKYLETYVHISTPEVYGTCKGVVKESYNFDPSTPYAASRAAGELSLKTYMKNYNFPLVVVRSANVYGKHQQLYRIIPKTIIYIKMKKVLGLHNDGAALRSFIHINDVSNCELKIMERGMIGDIFHISTEKIISVKELVKNICGQLNVNFDKVTKPDTGRLGQDLAYILSSEKARTILDWAPMISLEYGIQEMIQWIEENWEEIKKEPLEYVHKG